MPRLVGFYSSEPNIDLRINADNANVDFDESDMHAAVRFGSGKWPGLEVLKLADDWILPVCSQQLLDETGPVNSVQDLQQRELLFLESEMWDPWFRVMGKSTRDSRWSKLNDSISVLMAAEQGEGIALSRWSLVARDIEAGRLVRPIDAVVKADWSIYFVAPPHYFDLPKVVAFREWLLEHFSQFELPE
jgi:LysR family glycine cleavage system transcriptional activator